MQTLEALGMVLNATSVIFSRELGKSNFNGRFAKWTILPTAFLVAIYPPLRKFSHKHDSATPIVRLGKRRHTSSKGPEIHTCQVRHSTFTSEGAKTMTEKRDRTGRRNQQQRWRRRCVMRMRRIRYVRRKLKEECCNKRETSRIANGRIARAEIS